MTDEQAPTADATTLDTAGAPPLEPTSETTAAEPAASAETAPAADATATAAAAATDAAPAAATPGKGRKRVLRLIAGVYWLIARLFAIALFVGGVALGYNAFLNNQPPPTVIADPSVDGVTTPAAVSEFVTALTSNDSDALRSVVPGEPYQLLIAEMSRWGFTSISNVEMLSTFADGERTATAFVMTGQTDTGVPVTVNLIIHVDGGQIVSFR